MYGARQNRGPEVVGTSLCARRCGLRLVCCTRLARPKVGFLGAFLGYPAITFPYRGQKNTAPDHLEDGLNEDRCFFPMVPSDAVCSSEKMVNYTERLISVSVLKYEYR
jgi:hypothetical protein